MFDRLDRGWRVLATGISFLTFGIGGLLLRVLVFPALYVLVWQQEKRTRVARNIIRLTFRGFVGLMRLLGVLRYEITGLNRLERGGLLILANHPTLIDTVFLMAFVKNADCIVKSHLWNNPFTRGPVRAAAYISNEQGTELLEACIASLQAGNNLIVFPEGTRTPADGVISLKRGAANIAVRGVCAVTPVVIRCDPPTLGKGEKWWHVPERFAQFRIEVKEDIPIQHFIGAGQSDVMAARHLTEHLQHYFTEENQRHA
ncbi:lysophospholipid acyltransferase family protein [Undibacterium pigrum]|uniref:1-acyl-sn-glycerol-3-phosphate acyltransferase n=1 Tax=Undibacterium pigrum TaxID=401470 RepID=A0A318JDB2_9BURK|nr:lysophospholipid acyltransferase family protein [Undibacterium pigrum]PXX47578.1 1-acyl-sn-glycerol-3-phosphate acyltransferase [Undibacterium pigrum]